eukprot:CAMPEP_0168409808 /NCGR_PEP_ID=MMETSP0228-20121227/27372_1 /TAXON_ID=133427 /ORGANISM="Protoceratium reticulatum, Strain CCCM 535 (=CCMP 1889)" /LENGTH=106 /DNA_ID=CAMNT_0008423527 /DNA_START=62 /DNA_END=378 /DNA_ORIENTATION=+
MTGTVAAQNAVEAAKEWVFALSAILLCLYPVAILAFSFFEGRAAAQTTPRKTSGTKELHAEEDNMDKQPKKRKPEPQLHSARRGKGPLGVVAAGSGIAAVAVALAG